jgi:probable HAF family extracellular repeat protein
VKLKRLRYIAAAALFVWLAVPTGLVAGQQPAATGLASLPLEARGSISSQLAKLTSSDGVAYDYLSYSVAIDGDTVVLGTWLAKIGSNYEQGAAYVFVKPASGWANMTQTAKLTASDGAAGDEFGFAVSVSGNSVAVGSLATVGSNVGQGAAYVFVKPAGGWTNMTETAKLTASDGAACDILGWSVSISGDTIAAGEPGPLLCNGNNAGTAAAYVFVKPATGWANMTQTAELRASDGTLSDIFGFSISISGNTVAVGARGATTFGSREFQGAVYVFAEPASGWVNMPQTAKLTASNSSYADYLGTSVSVSGNTIVAGAPGVGAGRGAAYVFVEPAGGWANCTETAELTGGAPGDISGNSVAISGNTIVVGAPRWPAYDGPGAAYVFVKPKSGWKSTSHFNAKLAASDGAVDNYLGYAVGISGNTIVSGAYGANIGVNTNQGAAYVFAPSDSDLRQPGGMENAVEAPASDRDRENKAPRYKLIDLGTFGGPQSYVNFGTTVLNKQGSAIGWADTPTPDPFPLFCFNPDCFVSHAFQWQNGVVTDLGALPGGGSSQAVALADNGLATGNSQNGEIDPLIPGFPELRAVLWKDGQITDLGTLEGGHESLAFGVNSKGQVVGMSFNTTPDPFCLFAPGFCTTQTRAFLWQNGKMQDLGTLGGPDGLAIAINERSQVAGFSYTNHIPNPVADNCGVNPPTVDPFLWEQGKGFTDLGGLGGTCGAPNALNNAGQVVGYSDLAGDVVFRPALWDRGKVTDLGTFLGPGPPSYGIANSINDGGEIVGWADNQKSDFAALWKDGAIRNLGAVAGDGGAHANSINSQGQVVGTSGSDAHAFLWEDGGPIIDLNTLVASTSGMHLTDALFINDGGEIAATGLLANGDQHAFVLVPCGEGDESCGGAAPGAASIAETSPWRAAQPRSTKTPARPGFRGRGRI